MIFETHAHYDDESFNDDREALIRQEQEGKPDALVQFQRFRE